MEMINLIFDTFNSPGFWMAGVSFLLGYVWVAKTSDDEVLAAHINDLQTKKVDTDFHDTFIALTDTPGAYAGEAGKFLKVNAVPDALEFVDHNKALHTSLGLMPYSGGTFTSHVEAADHGTAATDRIVNVCYGTGAPPGAATTTIGTLFVKYTA